MQLDATRQAEVITRQAKVAAHQVEMIDRHQQQQPQLEVAFASHAPLVGGMLAPGVTVNVQENMGILADPIPP